MANTDDMKYLMEILAKHTTPETADAIMSDLMDEFVSCYVYFTTKRFRLDRIKKEARAYMKSTGKSAHEVAKFYAKKKQVCYRTIIMALKK